MLTVTTLNILSKQREISNLNVQWLKSKVK